MKSRIKHVLSFKKPAVWMGAAFAVMMVVVLAVFGTNGQAEGGKEVNGGVEENTATLENDKENTNESGGELEETEGTTEEMPQQPTEDYSDRTWDYNGAGDAWIDLAKDAFDKQWTYDSAQDIGEEKRKELFGIPKRLVNFPIGYTGFMDIYPDEKQCIPVQDYDGDGLMDRVFQRYIAETEDQEVYLFLGSGQVMMMDDSAWTGYWLESVDLTHDGKPEVTYWENIYYMGDGVEETYCTIYENTETGMQKMDGSGLFGIELIFERINENTLRITTPEGDFSYTLDISEYLDMLWWYYYVPKMDEKSKTETRWASYYYIYYDETSGKYKFRCWGGEILGFSMDWDVVYENGEWTTENVALRGVEMPFGSRELNRELTEKNLSKGICLQSLLGHRAENSETIYLDVDQSGGVYIYGDYFALGSRFCGFCDGVYAEDWEEMTITLDRELLPTVEENLPETLTIKRQTIDGEEYYVVDYLGENLYFYVHNK